MQLERLPGANPLAASAVPVIYNLTLTEANTEYPQTLPNSCRKFSVKARTVAHTLKLAFTANESSSNYITLTGAYSEDGISPAGLTLYLQSPQAGAIVEIVVWQ